MQYSIGYVFYTNFALAIMYSIGSAQQLRTYDICTYA